jgi:hypothetical protein
MPRVFQKRIVVIKFVGQIKFRIRRVITDYGIRTIFFDLLVRKVVGTRYPAQWLTNFLNLVVVLDRVVRKQIQQYSAHYIIPSIMNPYTTLFCLSDYIPVVF